MDIIKERDKLKNAEQAALSARAEADKAEAELKAFPSTEPELLDEIRGELSSLSMAEELRAEAVSTVNEARAALANAQKSTEGSVFSGKTPEQASLTGRASCGLRKPLSRRKKLLHSSPRCF